MRRGLTCWVHTGAGWSKSLGEARPRPGAHRSRRRSRSDGTGGDPWDARGRRRGATMAPAFAEGSRPGWGRSEGAPLASPRLSPELAPSRPLPASSPAPGGPRRGEGSGQDSPSAGPSPTCVPGARPSPRSSPSSSPSSFSPACAASRRSAFPALQLSSLPYFIPALTVRL